MRKPIIFALALVSLAGCVTQRGIPDVPKQAIYGRAEPDGTCNQGQVCGDFCISRNFVCRFRAQGAPEREEWPSPSPVRSAEAPEEELEEPSEAEPEAEEQEPQEEMSPERKEIEDAIKEQDRRDPVDRHGGCKRGKPCGKVCIPKENTCLVDERKEAEQPRRYAPKCKKGKPCGMTCIPWNRKCRR